MHITLQQRLTQSLAEHFYYPLLARKRGWHGAVHLAVTIDSGGQITRSRIIKSSGHSTLDQAALKSLSRVAGIDISLAREYKLEIPVIYQLNGG